jgi:hypothetical protein
MTEVEWLECTDVQKMLTFVAWSLGEKADRKSRLFAVACSRRVSHRMADERSREAIDVAERYADGMATLEQLQHANAQAKAATDGRYTEHLDYESDYDPDASYAAATAYFASYHRLCPIHYFSRGWFRGCADGTAYYAAEVVGEQAVEGLATTHSQSEFQVAWDEASRSEAVQQCQFLLCIFGNPFRPVAINPAWLAWNDRTIPKIAQAIYDERAFDRLPILADALEEAGCANQDILAHCRQSGEHVRGCWAVDLILRRP